MEETLFVPLNSKELLKKSPVIFDCEKKQMSAKKPNILKNAILADKSTYTPLLCYYETLLKAELTPDF